MDKTNCTKTQPIQQSAKSVYNCCVLYVTDIRHVMTFHTTDPLWGEFTSHEWIFFHKEIVMHIFDVCLDVSMNKLLKAMWNELLCDGTVKKETL